jgi:hypothetical protein
MRLCRKRWAAFEGVSTAEDFIALRPFGEGCTREEAIDTRTHVIRRGTAIVALPLGLRPRRSPARRAHSAQDYSRRDTARQVRRSDNPQ